MTDKDWYSNKDLFEMFQELRDMFLKEVPDLRAEMRDTKDTIKKYNGLREELGTIKNDVDVLKGCLNVEKESKKETKKDWQWTLGWIIGIGGLLLAVFK